ncbi:type II secretion system minor pseudopilin GspH [Pseudomonas sp. CAU 1711]|uniref:type II secretion system minor pseudopilin GspH n=1 Tax=Pseudomonas sp. CAU 1711 TaxID=3140356 RepID=UPI00326033DE
MRRVRGFTLIELLVVLVLLGVLTGIAVLGSGIARSPARELNDEAERLVQLMRVLTDEAVLDNREYGLRFERNAYQVLQYDPRRARWEAQGRSAYELPEWIELHIEVEEQQLFLPPSARGATKPVAKAAQPQLLILSSGELTPFRLQMGGAGRDLPKLVLHSDGFAEPRVETDKPKGRAG